MGERLVEGLWDCRYCGTKGIGGRKKYCPSCGHPQDKDTRFYLGQEKVYLDEEEAKNYGNGPDWLCEYCGSLNNTRFQYCKNCGSAREEAKKDYFTKDEGASVNVPVRAPEPAYGPTNSGIREWFNRYKMGLILTAGIILALIGVLAAVFMPKNQQATIAGKSWERTVEVEAYRTVQESDWTLPPGGRLQDKRQEIHHYDSVLDHYETKSREVAEQVFDGYDEYVSYSDNGDGTFTEYVTQSPRYRTEYRTEYYEEPVYIQVPNYQTRYYYEIEKWVHDRTEEAKGGEDTPQWPKVTLQDNEREGEKNGTYTLTIAGKKDKIYVVTLSEYRWNTYRKGDSVKITTSAGKIKKLDDVDVRE